MLAVVILAAGESRRMGRPKALIPFPGHVFSASDHSRHEVAATNASPVMAPKHPKTFLRHLMDVTRHPRAGLLRVVVGAHAQEIRASAKLDDEEFVVNENWRRGQLSSLQAAIRSLPSGATEGMLVCLVDHPLISADLVARLIEAFARETNKIIIPAFHGKRGHPVIFPAALFAELLRAPAEIGARAVVRAHAADVLEIPVQEEGVVLNLNDPESLQRITNLR